MINYKRVSMCSVYVACASVFETVTPSGQHETIYCFCLSILLFVFRFYLIVWTEL